MSSSDPLAPSPAEPHSTVDHLSDPGGVATARSLTARRWGYGLTTTVLTLTMFFAALDGVQAVSAFGVDTARVRSTAGSTRLEVRYTTVTRGALASPFEITVHRPGGFDGPVTVAVDHAYMQMWDENGFYPTPSSETTREAWLLWEFEPPDGDTLRFTYDARLEPGVQSGRSGAVALVEGGELVGQVNFKTAVRP